MSRILHHQSLWAAGGRSPTSPEPSIGERFDRAKADGFEGMTIDVGPLPVDEARKLAPHFTRTGLRAGVTAFPKSIEGLAPMIHFAKDIGAPFVTVVGQVTPLSVEGMIPVVREWLALARCEGMAIQFETHRACITNDLFSTVLLLDAVPEMRLAGDLSHYVVDREHYPGRNEAVDALFGRILSRCDSFQGRIATPQQVQAPIDFPQHRPWVEMFARWWTDGFAHWRAQHGDAEDMVFLCELGPGYAITDRQGQELSDRRVEARQLRAVVEECWKGDPSSAIEALYA